MVTSPRISFDPQTGQSQYPMTSLDMIYAPLIRPCIPKKSCIQSLPLYIGNGISVNDSLIGRSHFFFGNPALVHIAKNKFL